MDKAEPCSQCGRAPVETVAEAAARFDWIKLGSLREAVCVCSGARFDAVIDIERAGWVLSWSIETDPDLMIDRVIYAQLNTTVRGGPVSAAAWSQGASNAPTVELLHVTEPGVMLVGLWNPRQDRALSLVGWALYGVTDKELCRGLDDPALGPWLRARYGERLWRLVGSRPVPASPIEDVTCPHCLTTFGHLRADAQLLAGPPGVSLAAAVASLREALEEGEHLFSSRVESRLLDVERAALKTGGRGGPR